MYLNQVEAFVNIVKYRSFSRAARKLFLSQPTISAHIKSLETELGVQLLVRTTKDVLLSDAGTVFYEYALELLHLHDVAAMTMKNYSKNISGDLTIAASAISAQYILPDMMAETRNTHPGIRYKIRQMNSLSVMKTIEDFEAELGIAGLSCPAAKTRLSFEPFMEDRLVLITPNTTPFRQMDGVCPTSRLLHYPFILRESGSSLRSASEAFFNSLGMESTDLKDITEMDSTESIRQAVRNRLGLSFISEKAASDYARFGFILTFVIDSRYLSRSLYLVRHKNRALTPAAEYFYHCLKKKHCPDFIVP